MKKSKNYILTSDKMRKYSIIFQTELNSELSISATEENFQKKYSKNFSLSSLKSNKYLSSLDTIDEIFDEIINRISFKTPSLYEETNCLKIVIETFHSKFKEVTLYLEEKEKNINDKIEELYSIIKQLKEKEKIQDEKIKRMEEKIEELEKNNKKLNEIENNLINEKESLILKDNINYFTRLKNWINPNKKINFKLLYRMSRDGDSIRTFHNLCDNKGPTISLYQLNDGNIVGVYTPLNWDTSGKWKKDNETFVFNVNKNLKCVKKENNTDSIFCHISYSGLYRTLGYYESSQDSMKNLYFFNSDSMFRNGNKILDYNQNIIIEPKEVEVLSVI